VKIPSFDELVNELSVVIKKELDRETKKCGREKIIEALAVKVKVYIELMSDFLKQ